MTKPEYTFKRDLTFNVWHRKIGNKIYCCDIDFVEYDTNGNPIALIETKKFGNKMSDFQTIALTKTADKLDVPFFLIQYNKDMTKFLVEPINESATKYFKESVKLTEMGLIKLYYKIHDIKISEEKINLIAKEF